MNSKFFFNLEKTRYSSRTCVELIDANGKEVCDEKEIMKGQENFL